MPRGLRPVPSLGLGREDAVSIKPQRAVAPLGGKAPAIIGIRASTILWGPRDGMWELMLGNYHPRSREAFSLEGAKGQITLVT